MPIQYTDKELRKYLLGRLNEDEASAVDIQIISDEGFANKVSHAESDLIEAYLENDLSDEEIGSFHENFLTTDARRELMSETALFKRYAFEQYPKGQTAGTADVEEPSFFERVMAWYRPLTAFGAVAATALIAFAVWQFYGGAELSPLEKEFAALNSQDLRQPGITQGLSTVELNTGTFRSGSGTAKIDHSKHTDKIVFRLALPFRPSEGQDFSATLTSNGSNRFVIETVKAYPLNGGGELRVLLPKSAVAKGMNRISAVSKSDTSIVVDYEFRFE